MVVKVITVDTSLFSICYEFWGYKSDHFEIILGCIWESNFLPLKVHVWSELFGSKSYWQFENVTVGHLVDF